MDEPNFLKKYVSILENTEVPPRFAIWCGLSAISAMLERRIWADMGIYKIYPNMYIILVAESGRARKSTAVKITKKLLRATDPGPRQIAQKITPEALIAALRSERTDEEAKLMGETCGGIIIADELMTLINRKSYDTGLASLFIPFYDCEDKFEYQTRSHGTETVNYSHLSILGASTINSIREALPASAIGDGFTSRVLFIYTDVIPPPVAWTEFDATKAKTMEELTQHLQEIAGLSGKIEFTPEAKKFFIDEYNRYYLDSPFYDIPQLRAYSSRRHTHLVKIAMCLMVCEEPTLILDKRYLVGAKDIIEDAEGQMPLVLQQIVTSDIGELTEQVFRFIGSQAPVKRTTVMAHFAHKIDADALKKILETLMQAEKIVVDSSTGGALLFKLRG